MKTTQIKEMVSEYNLNIYSSVSDIIEAICEYFCMSSAYIGKKDLCAKVKSVTNYLIENDDEI